MQTVNSEEVGSKVAAADIRGKHWISAELKRLEQETRFLEEELEQVEKMENARVGCKEMLMMVESTPDPLLPLTISPMNPIWDRWFQGPRNSSRCNCFQGPRNSSRCNCFQGPRNSSRCNCFQGPRNSSRCNCNCPIL